MNDSSSPTIVKLVRPQRSHIGNESGISGESPLGKTITIGFISDLHLLSSRHDYARHEASVRQAVESCDVCIWGGDLFDFHWSCEGDGAKSRQIAIAWLRAWRLEFPEKVFVYLTGNHDAQSPFQQQLAEWAGPSPEGLTWPILPGATYACLDAVRIEDCLFTHGDVIESVPKWNGRRVSLADYRRRWQHERVGVMSPPVVRNGLYNAAVKARLHLATAGVAHRRNSVCIRLLNWVGEQPDWVENGLQRIVFGHTHRRMVGTRVAGIRFYNGGAAVRHVAFEPVIVRV